MSKHFVVHDDGIYAKEYFGDKEVTVGFSRQLVLSREVLDEAMKQWYGVSPLKCEHYQDGYCEITAQHWAVYCNGCRDKCSNGVW